MTAASSDTTATRRGPIKIVCSNYGCGEFYGELSRWDRVYIASGETWFETCPTCGREYVVRLTFTEVDKNGIAVKKPNYWKHWS